MVGRLDRSKATTGRNVMLIGAIMEHSHLSSSNTLTSKLLVEELFVHLMHNNCQLPVHLILPQSHLRVTFHADSTFHPDHFRCDSFLRFSHFPATLFRCECYGTTTIERPGSVRFSFPPIGSCLRFAPCPTFRMVLVVPGSCRLVQR